VRRSRWLASGVAWLLVVAVAGCGGTGTTQPGATQASSKTVRVGVAYDIGGPGDKSFNDAVAAGVERTKEHLEVEIREFEAQKNETDNDKYLRLKLLCETGYNPVIAVGFTYAGDPNTGPLIRATRDCPNTRFAIIDDVSIQAPNVANLVFSEEQGSYLVGAIAALKTRTGRIGFVGGCQVDQIRKFQAGYEAGARAIRPSIIVDVAYLSTLAEKCSGFNNPGKAQTVTGGIYDRGVDIVFQAAGGSGNGVFRAALSRHKFAIGVDSDQYQTVSSDLRGVILTSMIKRVDQAIFTFVSDLADGRFSPGTTRFDLEHDGVAYSTSGGRVDDIKPRVEALREKIISGQTVVPTTLPSG
jgi:basic membrane protein A and related proteins